HQYNESNYKGDVVGVLTQTSGNHQYQLSQCNIYSPYGMRWHANKNLLPAYQQTLFGFDGERTDPATGWQFLGAGHRTYNPQQRYFVSEDPAGSGYGFGSNNPIMNTDPSGNMPRWLGSTLKWANYIGSFGLGALHKKWANILGAVITSALTVATLGEAAETYGGTLLATAVMAGATAAGSVPVVAAAIPANKGLNIAASVIGVVEAISIAATAAFDIGLYLSGEKEALFSTDQELVNVSSFAAIGIPEADLTVSFGAGSANRFGLFSIGKLICNSFPHLIKVVMGKPYLYINTFDQLHDMFKLYTGLLVCDSMAMLIMAKILKNPIDLEEFEIFFRVKTSFMITSDLKLKIMRSRDYFEMVYYMFSKISNGKLTVEHFSEIQPISLRNIPINPGELLRVQVLGHTQIIGKLTDNLYMSYTTYANSNLNFDIMPLDRLERIIFNGKPTTEYRYYSITRFQFS
ncbi:MAG: RHS repeat-associated core domain-containing protein, partial [Endozoicomonadaceae bacterium]|nr:RHS repeat-associated core domain-containing protein [Endozoicomonadaceae bacterium]